MILLSPVVMDSALLIASNLVLSKSFILAKFFVKIWKSYLDQESKGGFFNIEEAKSNLFDLIVSLTVGLLSFFSCV